MEILLLTPPLIAPLLLAGLIAGVASLAGAGISAYGASRAARQNRIAAREAAEYNTRINRENWAMENAYNDPSEQVKRYTAAGLNPNLVAGLGSSNAGGIAASNMEYVEEPNYGSILGSGLADAVSLALRASSLQLQEQNANVYQRVQEQKMLNDSLKAESQRLKNQYDSESFAYRLESQKWRTQNDMFKATLKNNSDLEKTKAEINYKLKQIDSMRFKDDETKARANMLRKQIGEIESQIFLNYARMRSLNLDMSLKESLFPELKQNLSLSNAYKSEQVVGANLDSIYKDLRNALSRKKLLNYDSLVQDDFINKMIGNGMHGLPNAFLKLFGKFIGLRTTLR